MDTRAYMNELLRQSQIAHAQVADSLANAMNNMDFFEKVFDWLQKECPGTVVHWFIQPPKSPTISIFVDCNNTDPLLDKKINHVQFNIHRGGKNCYVFTENLPAGSDQIERHVHAYVICMQDVSYG